ncbi:MAG TPA: hypothetical protein VIP82_02870 [Microbacterium sp.]|uniref:hypothetical protein n=1 Tax=Microbacterium sp. TaxID=51671 RepID=UPI002F92A637
MAEPILVEKSFYIRVVAREHRLKGEREADEALVHALDSTSTDPLRVEDGYRDFFCEIHWRNHPSKKLFSRAGIESAGHAGELETWLVDLGNADKQEHLEDEVS